MEIRPALSLKLRDRNALLNAFFQQGAVSGLFVPGQHAFDAGTEVDLQITVNRPATTFHMRGSVRWRRVNASDKLLPGIGVGFLSSEIKTRDLLLEFAAGREVRLIKRRSRRYPVMIRIQYKTDSTFLSDLTDDLSQDGAFIATDESIPAGTEIKLRLKPPGFVFPIRLEGRVRWCQKEGRTGIGVQFMYHDARTRKKMRRVIDLIEQRIARELKL